MKIKNFALVIVAAAMMLACSPNSVKSFTKVVDDAEQNGAKYTEEEWETADAKYEDFMAKFNDSMLSQMKPEEQREVGRLIARYQKMRLSSYLNSVGKEIDKYKNMTSGYMEEMGSDSVNGPEQMLDGFLDELLDGLLEE